MTAVTAAFLARYRFTFRALVPLPLPGYAGSVLRGQFGAALRQVSCMTGLQTCQPCPLRTTCPYPALFENLGPVDHPLQHFSHIPNPYVIEPPAPATRPIDTGQVLQFGMVLFGSARDRLPLVGYAMQRMFQNATQGKRARARLESIEVETTVAGHYQRIWSAGDTAIAAHEATFAASMLQAAAPQPEQITLAIHTPLRLQHQGRPLRLSEFTPRKLVADLLRRITLLAEFHAGLPGLIDDVPSLVRHASTLTHTTQLHWQDWSRYSARQRRQMTLGGALGKWTLRGDLQPLLPWLRLGQWTHVGKNATMGMGHYRLQ